MRILVIDDRQVDRRIGTQAAREFGDVREASSLEAARAVFASGWRPVVVLTDLHMAGADPLETYAAVLAMADDQRTVVIALTGDLGDAELVRQFRMRFPSSRLIAKDVRVVRDVLAAIRVDEAGHAVSTMDQGSIASHDQIRAIVDEWAAEKLTDLGLSWYDLRVWRDRVLELKREGFGWSQMRDMALARVRCLSARERIGWAVGLAVLVLSVTTIAAFLGQAVYQAILTSGGLP